MVAAVPPPGGADRFRQLPEGSRIESEVSLAAKVGVSRSTLRRALQSLVDHGVLQRRPGSGTQVVTPVLHRPLALSSLFDDLRASGRDPRTQVLSFTVVPASDSLALALRIPARSEVVCVRRLRFAGAEPLALMTNHLPAGAVRLDADLLEREGLYACLREAGGPVPSLAEEVIGARAATAEEGRLLRVPTGSALLTLTRTAWIATGEGVEHGSHLYRADRYAFEHYIDRV